MGGSEAAAPLAIGGLLSRDVPAMGELFWAANTSYALAGTGLLQCHAPVEHGDSEGHNGGPDHSTHGAASTIASFAQAPAMSPAWENFTIPL